MTELGAATRVMVVDDEQLIRWSVSRRLEKLEYVVTTAASGEECLELLPGFAPDVLLLDVRLPGIDGIEVLKRARALRPELTVIMLSAHATVELAVEAMRQGASDFITKPFELATLQQTLARAYENVRLRRQVAALSAEREAVHRADTLVGSSAKMQHVRELVDKLGRSEASTALVQGESGTGKAVVARAIHAGSRRAASPFLSVNCTSLPEQLVENELYGHERGAYTDAKTLKQGLFELADGGTVLLDEIGDMALGAQAKLLQFLEEKTFKRVGGTVDLRVDVRLIAATHRDLRRAVEEGRFRQDLYFRLNIVSVTVPPLRERIEDVPELVAHFISVYNREFTRQVRGVAETALAAMTRYSWPGNVRELRNVVERAFILEARDEIGIEHLPPEILEHGPGRGAGTAAGAAAMGLYDTERAMIEDALDKAYGNQTRAAQLLGISRDTLRYRIKKYGIQ